jgi:hypothetical protein
MGRRELTGAQLARDIGISATSVSRIITGHSKPRQVTLTRLMKRLCAGTNDEQLMLRAFTGVEIPAIEEPLTDDPQNSIEERERVERWLESRTQAITFKNAVEQELKRAGIAYRRDYCEGIASVDFLVETTSGRIALECKFNVSRDFEKTVGIARLLCELVRCARVVIVVPFVGDFVRLALTDARTITICTPSDAVALLKQTSAA